MKTIIKFGEDIEGYHTPVLNEREIRAAAGILFLMMLISIMTVILRGSFTMLKYSITIFLTDILIRVLINPKFSPSLIIGRLMVRNQTPEYVGAKQKKFAWIIGVLLASVMFALQVVVNAYSPITGLICFICLIFLFFETAFGICLGCKFYPLFYKEKAEHCPGDVCTIKKKEEIQKTSVTQLLIVACFIGYILITAYFFNDKFIKKPYNLFGIGETSTQIDNIENEKVIGSAYFIE